MSQSPITSRRVFIASAALLIALGLLAAFLAPGRPAPQVAANPTATPPTPIAPTATPADLPPAPMTACPPRAKAPANAETPILRLGEGGLVDFDLSPDGQEIVEGRGGGLFVYGAGDYSERWSAPADSPALRVAYSPDGARIAATLDDSRVMVWDASTHALAWSDRDPCDDLLGLAFSADSRLVATGGKAGVIHLRDAAGGTVVRSLYATGDIQSLAFSPDGRWLAAGSWGDVTTIWDVRSWRQVRAFEGGSEVAWSRDSKRLGLRFSGSYRILSVPGWQLVDHAEWSPISSQGQKLPPEFDDHTSLTRYSADGHLEYGYVWQFAILHVYDRVAKSDRDLERGWLTQALFLPGGQIILTLDRGVMTGWDLATGRKVYTSQPAERLGSMAISPDGHELAVGLGDASSILMWDVTARQWTGERFDAPYDDVYRVVFSPDGRWIAAFAIERVTKGNIFLADPKSSAIVVWSRASRQIAKIIPMRQWASPTLTFTAASDALLIGDLDVLTRWDIAVDTISTSAWTQKPGNPKAVSPDGFLEMRFEPSSYRAFLVDTLTRKPLRELSGARDVLAWSSDSRLLAAGSESGQVLIWDVR